jgi:deoxyribonuclease-1-like protein
MKFTLLFLLISLLGFSQVDTTKLNIISWNIQNFGRSKSESDSVMKYITSKVKIFDIVAIQEVSTSEFGAQAVAKLDGLLDRTGTSWDYVVSNPTTGPGSERYAYLYKKSRVKLKEKPELEKTLQDKLNREPFKAVFLFKSNEYYLFNLHLVPTDKNPSLEATQLSSLGDTYKGKRIVFMGDLNLSQSDPGFNGVKKWSKPTLIGKKTSLKMKEVSGEKLNMEYDNFFISSNIILVKSGVINFFLEFKELKTARKVSDHCPIYCIIK